MTRALSCCGGGGGGGEVALTANVESSGASAVVNVALPGHHGQIDVHNLIGIGAGDLVKSTRQAGVTVTTIQ